MQDLLLIFFLSKIGTLLVFIEIFHLSGKTAPYFNDERPVFIVIFYSVLRFIWY